MKRWLKIIFVFVTGIFKFKLSQFSIQPSSGMIRFQTESIRIQINCVHIAVLWFGVFLILIYFLSFQRCQYLAYYPNIPFIMKSHLRVRNVVVNECEWLLIKQTVYELKNVRNVYSSSRSRIPFLTAFKSKVFKWIIDSEKYFNTEIPILKSVLKFPLTGVKISNALLKLIFWQKCIKFGYMIIEIKIH